MTSSFHRHLVPLCRMLYARAWLIRALGFYLGVMTKITSILTIILFLTAWIPQAQTSVPADAAITLQRFTDPFNNGTDYRVTINSDGAVTFKRFANHFVDRGDPRAQESEPIRAKIPVEKVALLVAEFERVKFFSLKDRYAKPEDGCPTVGTDQGGALISITIGGKTKTIDHYHGCEERPFEPAYPPELTALEDKIDEFVGTGKWLKP